jgi:hypothetical protein
MDITEVAKILANRINQEHYILHYMEKVFKAGQSYQAKSMYNKEDMKQAFENGLRSDYDSDFVKWLEQFKKNEQ